MCVGYVGQAYSQILFDPEPTGNGYPALICDVVITFLR